MKKDVRTTPKHCKQFQISNVLYLFFNALKIARIFKVLVYVEFCFITMLTVNVTENFNKSCSLLDTCVFIRCVCVMTSSNNALT